MPTAWRDKAHSHLRIQSIAVPVSDLRRSVEFYGTTLGFRVLYHGELESGIAFAAVAPMDGTAILVLIRARSSSANGNGDGRVVRHD